MTFPTKKKTISLVLTVAAGAFFFSEKTRFLEKRHFLFWEKLRFFQTKKNDVFWFYKDMTKSYRDRFIIFFAVNSQSLMKYLVRTPFSKNHQKRIEKSRFWQCRFSSDRIFRLGIFNEFQKNAVFFDDGPRDVTISVFFYHFKRREFGRKLL